MQAQLRSECSRFGSVGAQRRLTVACAAPPKPSARQAETTPQTVTIEYQRSQAKDLVAWFKAEAEAEAIQRSQVFGWTKANEINNGRWVMMGWLIGLMTEYATGVDFPHQLALILSYMGIADVEY